MNQQKEQNVKVQVETAADAMKKLEIEFSELVAKVAETRPVNPFAYMAHQLLASSTDPDAKKVMEALVRENFWTSANSTLPPILLMKEGKLAPVEDGLDKPLLRQTALGQPPIPRG